MNSVWKSARISLLLVLAWGSFAQDVGKVAPKPLFRDPLYDGAADPVLVWNRAEKKWMMFYTDRRASVPNLPGVSWVHGTPIGIVESSDGGATWKYVGTVDVPYGKPDYTYWAPDIIDHDGTYHMFLSIVPGIFQDWNAGREIIHLTSKDLHKWNFEARLDLNSDRVIDPSLLRLPNGTFRMWYKNERAKDGSLYYADSPDLYQWTSHGNAIPRVSGEGPKIFRWKDHYWMMVDVWDGIAVFRSDDCLAWTRQPGNLLKEPGTIPTDRYKGNHVDVVVSNDRAWLFYFVHQGGPDAAGKDREWQHRSVIQVVELKYGEGALSCDRNAPTHIALAPASAPVAANQAAPAFRTGVLHEGYNPALPTLFLIGDSTVKNSWDKGDGGLWGWGRPLTALFDASRINVENQALGGTSSRSYITGGHWERVLALVKSGDYVMMQFGHNDGGPAGSLKGNGDDTEERAGAVVHSYGWYIRKYIADTKAKGATPIVCSLIPRNDWTDGKVHRGGTYAVWAQEAAKAGGAAFIDLNTRIADRYDQLGQDAVKPFFPQEHTHTGWDGAMLNAQCVKEGIKALLDCPLKDYLQ